MTPASPTSIGFIMDGNRRWAKERGLSALDGHRAGYEATKLIARALVKRGVPHGVFYVFSTENWRRSQEEVSGLMALLEFGLREFSVNPPKEDARMRVIGQRDVLSPVLRDHISELEEKTAARSGSTTLWFALSYGGRAEIAAAARSLAAQGREITESSISTALWSAEMPEPDLIIRTGGEHRLSNFLTWQSVYSELFFTPTYWPAFTEEEFERILLEYGKRERRHGA
jgi:undecaprenyl diphosphate synthase